MKLMTASECRTILAGRVRWQTMLDKARKEFLAHFWGELVPMVPGFDKRTRSFYVKDVDGTPLGVSLHTRWTFKGDLQVNINWRNGHLTGLREFNMVDAKKLDSHIAAYHIAVAVKEWMEKQGYTYGDI